MECTGGESRLLDCSSYQEIGIHNCFHSEDAGVGCNGTYFINSMLTSYLLFSYAHSFYPARGNECCDGSIRLSGSSVARQGRVEICVEGRWGTVCDTYWDSIDAAVVCRQLGYPSIGEYTMLYFTFIIKCATLYISTFPGAIAYFNAQFGYGSGPIWLDSLSCTGRESSLLNCSHGGIGVKYSFCGHDDDAGVQCPGKRNRTSP